VNKKPEDHPDELEVEDLFINRVQILFFWLHLHELLEGADGDVVANFLFLHFQKSVEPFLV